MGPGDNFPSLSSGDTLIVSGAIKPSNNLYLGHESNVTIRGESRAIIDGDNYSVSDIWDQGLIQLGDCSNVTIKDLEIKNAGANAVDAARSNNVIVRNCEIHHNGNSSIEFVKCGEKGGPSGGKVLNCHLYANMNPYQNCNPSDGLVVTGEKGAEQNRALVRDSFDWDDIATEIESIYQDQIPDGPSPFQNVNDDRVTVNTPTLNE